MEDNDKGIISAMGAGLVVIILNGLSLYIHSIIVFFIWIFWIFVPNKYFYIKSRTYRENQLKLIKKSQKTANNKDKQ